MGKLWKLLKTNKEGIIIGAVVGYIVGRFLIPADFDFSIIMQSQSILDTFKSAGTTAIEFAKTKMAKFEI